MELLLIFKVLGFLGSVCVIAVKSDDELLRNELNLFAPPPPPPPPPPYLSPPPPPPSSPPPPLSPPLRPPPPPQVPLRFGPPPRKSKTRSKNKPWRRRPPYPKFNVRNHPKGSRLRMNRGKEIGCWFVGVAGVIQVAAIVFLVYKRREISKFSDRL